MEKDRPTSPPTAPAGVIRGRDGAANGKPAAHGDSATSVERSVPPASVRIEVIADPRPLPSGVDLSVYGSCRRRYKRADPAEAFGSCAPAHGPGPVTAMVEDDGRGASAAALSGTGGQGLVGMRERAALLGGDLTFGPRADGGFHVSIHLPA